MKMKIVRAQKLRSIPVRRLIFVHRETIMENYIFKKTEITENLETVFLYAEDKNCSGECKPKPESNICPVTNKCS